MKKVKLSLFTVLICALISCAPKNDTTGDSDNGSTGGGGTTTNPLTVAQLTDGAFVTWWGTCVATTGMGADLDGTSYFTAHTFHSNNNYDYSVQWYSDATCGMGVGEEIFAYDEFGTFSVATSASDSSGATVIDFARGSEMITMYAGHAPGATWAGYFNSYCSGGVPPGLSTNSTSTTNPFGFICSHTGSMPDFTFPLFPNTGAAKLNIGTYNGTASPKTLTLGTPSNPWYPGDDAVPTGSTSTFNHM